MILSAAVNLADLGRVVVAAMLAGVGVTAVFSLALLGATRSVEARREARSAWGWRLLALVGTGATGVAVTVGVYAVAH